MRMTAERALTIFNTIHSTTRPHVLVTLACLVNEDELDHFVTEARDIYLPSQMLEEYVGGPEAIATDVKQVVASTRESIPDFGSAQVVVAMVNHCLNAISAMVHFNEDTPGSEALKGMAHALVATAIGDPDNKWVQSLEYTELRQELLDLDDSDKLNVIKHMRALNRLIRGICDNKSHGLNEAQQEAAESVCDHISALISTSDEEESSTND